MNNVQCCWHISDDIYPFWKIQKAEGPGNYYIKTHRTYWSGNSEWRVLDSSYLAVESHSEFLEGNLNDYYLVVNPKQVQIQFCSLMMYALTE